MWSWLFAPQRAAVAPVAPAGAKPALSSGDWRVRQYLERAVPPRSPRPEVCSADFRRERYEMPLPKHQWMCQCGRASLLEEEYCRHCNSKSPQLRAREALAAQRQAARRRQEDQERQARADEGRLTAADLRLAHDVGFEQMPLSGFEEKTKVCRELDKEAYTGLLRMAAMRAGHVPEY
ncbi:unnamed protein product [Effrenium voratum]|uniref:Uncharacterized protein n=1 Tax=Effrenium voratum TaxID=2562239 RepID=A0AA36NIX4_9DINO|nr:unnamed protein product [Effrenium voratum]CAJ1455573.1 unnamed protein product [Effrenium voratum]